MTTGNVLLSVVCTILYSMIKRVIIFSFALMLFRIGLGANISVVEGDNDTTQFIQDLKRRTFNYFWQLADPHTAMIPDRAPTKSFSSIAATGFGLAALVTGIEEGYITREQGARRVLTTLLFFRNMTQAADATNVGGYRGFFYHFVDIQTGHRYKKVELSTIDTGLLMAGVLTCYSYFSGNDATEQSIRDAALQLYTSVEWDWAMQSDGLMSMGWTPENGFIDARWHGYNEAMILLILALGSPTHPIADGSWEKWTDGYKWADFEGWPHVNFGPLFGHHYSHMFIDFNGIQDPYMRLRGIDYFENSRRATLGQQAYCIRNPKKFNDYSATLWGLTACDGPGWTEKLFNGKKIVFEGYAARGASSNYGVDDGTLAPAAAGGSIPFAPEICIPALMALKDQYPGLYADFGFKDAVNPSFTDQTGKPWINPDYLGIDQGPILIMMQNYQKATIWNILKQNPFIVKGLRRAGFSGGWLERAEKRSSEFKP